jgi:D-alanyl-D-alanine carboxypeptidase
MSENKEIKTLNEEEEELFKSYDAEITKINNHKKNMTQNMNGIIDIQDGYIRDSNHLFDLRASQSQ